MKAKYYIYRNLHKTGFFSIRYKGKVIDHQDVMVGLNAEFRVNNSGYERARKTAQRNVHAFVVVDDYIIRKRINLSDMVEVTYNPFYAPRFYIKTTGKRVFKVEKVYLYKGKVYINVPSDGIL